MKKKSATKRNTSMSVQAKRKALFKRKPLALRKFRANELRTFWAFLNERHEIYIRRFRDKKKPPYTKDKILRTYKFTNVFRQLDRVTQAWTDRFIKLLGRGKDMTDGDLLFHCCMFRYFNWPETYDTLYYGMRRWNKEKAKKLLENRKAEGKQIFTGAYIITSGGRPESKINVICDALDELYLNRNKIAKYIVKNRSMQKTVEELQTLYTVGPFVAYEIACDLRYTRLLMKAHDTESWANPGPGAKRGIHRLLTGKKDKPKEKIDYNEIMRELLLQGQEGSFLYRLEHKRGSELPFEMREIEHTLCEFDKYMRVKNGEGRPRSRFVPYAEQLELPW